MDHLQDAKRVVRAHYAGLATATPNTVGTVWPNTRRRIGIGAECTRFTNNMAPMRSPLRFGPHS